MSKLLQNHVKLAVINVPATDPEGTSKFYSKLLGREFTRSPTDATVSYGAPLEDGIYMTVKRKERADETVTIFFAVVHLEQAIAAFVADGGKLLLKHELAISPKAQKEYADGFRKVYGWVDSEVPSHMGSSAVVADNEGNRIGLIEVHEHAHVMFKLGKHGKTHTPIHDAAHEVAKSIEKALAKP